ncbi:MAG: DUF5320 domain-containing protein [Candidatus Omnitrophota bacterium]
MPGFNSTGPRGQGPFTGGGRGYCVGYLNVPGRNARLGGGGGLGRGFGRRNLNIDHAGQYEATISPEVEAESLKQQSRLMQDEIIAINQRIKELEGK